MPCKFVQTDCFVLTIDVGVLHGREGFSGGWAMAVFRDRACAGKALEDIQEKVREVRRDIKWFGGKNLNNAADRKAILEHPNTQYIVDTYPETFGTFGRCQMANWVSEDVEYAIEHQPFFRKRFLGLF